MPRRSDKRERLVQAADRLALHQGFGPTTLADIANESNVPLGNVYYYFKTKQAIGDAIIEIRLARLLRLLDSFETLANPKKRLLAYLDHVVQKRRSLTEDGCPLGTLCYELARTDPELSDASTALIRVLLNWSRDQFALCAESDAAALALQFTSALEGAFLIANTLHDPQAITAVVGRLRDWIKSL